MKYLLAVGVLVFALVIIGRKSKVLLYIMQWKEYDINKYKDWIDKNRGKIHGINIIKKRKENKLVYTDRLKRLSLLNTIINGIIIGIPLFFYIIKDDYLILGIGIILSIILYIIQSSIIVLSSIFIQSIEENINKTFFNQAKMKIEDKKKNNDLIVIGIAGSFGKTSTKFILDGILKEKYNILISPESYNTPMGLSKIINERLDDSHEIFIAELGARKVGEIREICDLVSPDIGVITSIGPVHLETFYNYDNIMKTKYELIEELPADGIIGLNCDNKYIQRLADKTFKEMIRYGMEDTDDLDLYAEDIIVFETGSRFTLTDKNNNSVRCSSNLLGKHSIINILGAASMALALGMSLEEISNGIAKIKPIAHRLNIIRPESGEIIIDDTFNSNPIGTKAALQVLSQFKSGDKIIITPGMIELGEMEEEANNEFGKDIGKVCDYVILIGKKRTRPIYNGLMKTNYNKDNIIIVDSLEDANKALKKIVKPEDIVLYENNIPDNY